MKYTLLAILLILLRGTLFAQEVKTDKLSPIEYFKKFQFQKATDTLELKTYKTALDFFLLAKCYKRLGQVQDASTAIDSAIELDNSNVSFLNFLGEQQLRKGEKVAAYKSYLTLCQLQPNNAYYFKKIGQSLNNVFFTRIREQQILFVNNDSMPKKEKEKDLALEKFRALKLPSNTWQAYEMAIELNPNDIESKLILTELYLKINNMRRADPLNKQSLKMHPENSKFIMQAIKISYRLRDYQDVVEKSKLFYSKGGSKLEVQKLEGIAQYHLKSYKECIELLSNVIEVEKDSEVLHYYLGLSYQEMGENQEAVKYLQKAIELGITENIENYYTRLAVVYEELGNFEKSIQLYKAAYAETKDKILLYHLARNYDTFYKDKNTALKYYELYLEELDSSNIEYMDYSKNRINELKVEKHFNLDTL